ncbi:MAG: hypothetical protein LBK26_04050 [Rickettsiales bacterium]|jgi:predicted house-cleaning noncanonical NTP pyrophosphatase (MazG superfamily)|nr:hypothetical protein [Rickettsiales bacterium]
MNPSTKQVITDVIKYKGKNFAVLYAIEEFAELTKELLKDINRHKDNIDDIFEEVADVSVIMEYLKLIYNISDDKIWDYLNKKMPEKWAPRIEKWKARVADTGNPDANKRILD